MRLSSMGLLALLAALAAGLSGCVETEVSSVNPEFAGSMKLTPGLFTTPTPLGELPGSRVREGE